MKNMQVVSSPWTLALKLLLPTFWFCFFGGLSIILLFYPLEELQDPFTPMTARLMTISFVLSTAGIYYLVFFPIKWVGMDTEYIYVSNFMKSYQYTYSSIVRVEESRMLLWNKVTIHFHEPTQFGKTIVFFGSYYWYYFLKKHPEVLQQLLPQEILENLEKNK
jgi:hypothetical protein